MKDGRRVPACEQDDEPGEELDDQQDDAVDGKDDTVGYGDVEPAEKELENSVEPGEPFGVFDAEESLIFGGLFKGKGGIFVDHEVAQ